MVAGGERRSRELAGHPFVEAQLVGVAVTVHLGDQPGGEGVDYRCPYPVQPAGSPVGATAELAAGVELGEDDLQCGDLCSD